MASATSSAVFAIIAKDAASAVMGRVGKSMGKLRGAAATAFKAMAAGAAAAATAIATLAIAAIKGAAEDEKATIRLNAALKARGFEMDKLTPKIEAQMKAMQRYGISDDEVRKGLEVGSRFFKGRNNLLKANAVAADIALVTETDLGTAMLKLGRASQGSQKALNALGIEVGKGAGLQEILAAATAKYGGAAEELAESTAVKFEAAQLRLNEALETMGGPILDLVADGLDYLTVNALPLAEEGLAKLGQGIADTITGLTAPGGMVESVGKVVGSIVDGFKPELEAVVTALTGPDGLFTAVGKLIAALWGDGEGALAGAFMLLGKAIEAAFALAKPFFDALTWLVNNIAAVVDALTRAGGAQAQAEVRASQSAAAGSTVFGLGAGAGGVGGTGGYSVYNSITFGRDATSSINTQLGQTATATGRTRVGKRRP
jgi:hypothetical protein